MSAFNRKSKEPTVLPALHAVAKSQRQGRVAGGALETRLQRGLRAGLKTTALGLGLLRLQLDAGLTDEAGEVLARLQEELQLLRRAVESQAEDQPGRPAAQSSEVRRALLVEDDCNQRELLAGFLRQSGLKVDIVGDGVDALDYLGSQGRPDVILLDMGLPRLDGPTTLRHIRRNPAYGGIKIFGVSGHAPEEFNLQRGPQGVDGWFHKPLDPAALVHDLAEELDGSPCSV